MDTPLRSGFIDRCDGDLRDPEGEVEALPDSHYGLLGSRKVLLEPQGCVDDLPEEVLRQVLCLVPAKDLYRSVSRVCHRWRNIVQDAKFVPFKKRYFRYTMRETETVREVCSALRDSGITDPAASKLSIRSLVIGGIPPSRPRSCLPISLLQDYGNNGGLCTNRASEETTPTHESPPPPFPLTTRRQQSPIALLQPALHDPSRSRHNHPFIYFTINQL